jgi:hypothetical protein
LLVRKLMERETIRRIREILRAGELKQPFRPSDINAALGIDWAGTFLPKHSVGNPGGNSELFVRVSRGLYRLR